MAEILGSGVVAVEPDATVIEYLDEDIGADREGYAGVEEVAGVDDNRSAAMFGFESAESSEEIFDRAVALEQMHVFGATEEAVECCGENDDGNVGTAAAQKIGNFGAELSSPEMVVKHGYIRAVEEFSRLFDGGGGKAVITVLPQDGRAEEEIIRFIVQQKDANTRST